VCAVASSHLALTAAHQTCSIGWLSHLVHAQALCSSATAIASDIAENLGRIQNASLAP